MSTLARQQQRQNVRWLLCLSVLMLLALLLSLCTGEQWVSPGDWFAPCGRLFVWQICLPRMLAVLLADMTPTISDAIVQALFENPPAEPRLLGVSSGAGVGLIAAVLLGQGQLPNWALGLCATAGALITTLILLRSVRRHLSASRLLLAGVTLGVICSALVTWAIYFSTSVDLRQLMCWMMGGSSGIDWWQGWLMLALISVLSWIYRQPRPVNMLTSGEISARQLGLLLWFWRNVLMVATGWMVDVSVALAGTIGFIGLAIPHILRLYGLTDHRVLLPGYTLARASALLLADIVVRLALAAAELPIGVITVTLDTPMFIWLLLKAGRQPQKDSL